MTALRSAWDHRFWLITAAAILGVALTISLGLWQLSRADQKQALQAAQDRQSALPALSGLDLMSSAPLLGEAAVDARLHRAVRLQGVWMPEHTVYLDNRQMQGRPGFFVLTPLALLNDAGVVLVQRGWAPRNFQDRSALPPVQTPSGVVTIDGRVSGPPARLYEFDAAPQVPGTSRIRQNLDLDAFRSQTGLPLASLTVLQMGVPGEGLLREWPVTAVGAGVDKHYGYAFQWFGLSGLISVLYVWFQIFRRFVRPRSQSIA